MGFGTNPAFRSRSLVRSRIGAFRASDAGSNPAGSIPNTNHEAGRPKPYTSPKMLWRRATCAVDKSLRSATKVKREDERVPDEKPKSLAVEARHEGAELHPQDDAGSARLSPGFSRSAGGALLLSRGLEPRVQRPTRTLRTADVRIQEVRR